MIEISPRRIDKTSTVLETIDTIIFDCDGVIWRGKELIPDVVQTINSLRQRNKKLFFLTNNSTKSRSKVRDKFEKLGLHVHLDEILTSSYLVANYLKAKGWNLFDGVYVIGRKGIFEELSLIGINAFGLDDDRKEFDFDGDIPDMDKPVGAVIVGFDQEFNYMKLAKSMNYLSNPNCLFIATNIDPTYPDAKHILPGTGTVVAAIQAASQREPFLIGKPSSLAFEIIRAFHQEIDPRRTLMVGDNIQTDIFFGRNCGLQTLLVETGVHTERDLIDFAPGQRPHYIASSVVDLIDLNEKD